MRVRELLPDKQSLKLESIEKDDPNQFILIRVRSIALSTVCPCCSQASKRVHSWYERKLKDLPWHGLNVRIRWTSRRFFCTNTNCHRKIFTERQPAVAAVFSRRTVRLSLAHRSIAIACGGEVGARLGERLGITVSPDTLLREARSLDSADQHRSPRVVGVDDWAFCKGKRYGTLICDLERGGAIELLPDRSAESLSAWLANHQGIEIVSRDRGDIYRKGADQGAPNAVQVADRFHLVKNLRDAFARFLEGQTCQIREAFANLPYEAVDREEVKPKRTHHLTVAQKRKAANRRRRETVYKDVVQLKKQGISARAIAKQLGIHRGTVGKYLRADAFPERAPRRYPSSTDKFREALWARWNAGCHNASVLWKEIVAAGYEGSYSSVRRLTQHWRTDDPTPRKNRARTPSPNQVSWMLFKKPSKLTEFELSVRQEVLRHCHEIRAAWRLTQRFLVIVAKRKGQMLPRWVEKARQDDVPISIRTFAIGLKKDWDAVVAGLTLRWNNGAAEGHINRLKMIKRQMFGRANFDLLRAPFSKRRRMIRRMWS